MADAVKRPSGGGRRRGSEGPHPIDIYVGARLRMRRTLLGMSQEKLAESVGVTFQQIQKYERGANRIGSSRLHQFSKVLDVPVAYFFDGLEEEGEGTPGGGARTGLAEGPAERFDNDIMTRRETIELIRAYYRITDVRIRRRLMDLTKALGGNADGEEAKEDGK